MPAVNPICSPPASSWEWILAGTLAANLAWTTLANGGLGGVAPVVTLGLTAALAALHAVDLARAPAEGAALHPAGWLVLPFSGYALANVLWVTPVRWLGWLDWTGWLQMTVIFWVAVNSFRSRGPRRALFHTLVFLALAGVAIGAYQKFVDGTWRPCGGPRAESFLGRASGSFGIPNSLAGLLLLLLPAAGALAVRPAASAIQRVWWSWVGLVLLTGLVLTESRGAWLALVLVLPGWALVAARGPWRRRVAIAAAIGLLLVAAGAVLLARSPSIRLRFTQLVHDGGEVTRPQMWWAAWKLFRDAPVLGTGAGSYNILIERHRPEGFRDEPQWAHQEYLNTLSDYGLAGFGLWAGGAGAILVGCLTRRRRALGDLASGPRAAGRVPTGEPATHDRTRGLTDPFVVGGLGAGLAAFGLQMALDFHLKVPALALAAAVVAGLAVRAAWPSGRSVTARPAWIRRAGVGATAVAVLGVVLGLGPRIHAEQVRDRARRAVDRLQGSDLAASTAVAVLGAAQRELRKVTTADPGNARAWADLAHVTLLLVHGTPMQAATLAREAESAADRAVGLCPVLLEGWVRRGIARDVQGRWLEARADFVHAITLGPTNSRAWYHHAFHLSRDPAERKRARATVEYCLRLDPWNLAALALRKQLASVP